MATVTKPIALDESLNTTELSSRNVADVLAQELSAVATAIGGISAPSAEDVSYDNSGSGLSATDVQNAIDELSSEKADSSSLATVATSGDYDDLINKPTIPTVNDATLTIQKNGSDVATFTANASSNVTANVTVPTTTSELTNNSDFVSDASYVHTDNNFTNAEKTKLSGIESGAEVNVQSDWNQTDNTADDFIKNKPSSEVKSATDTFTTVNGGLLEECIIDLVPVQSGSGDPSPDNVRPISGHTEIKLQNVGKNRLPLSLADIKSTNTAGTWSGNNYTFVGITFKILTDNLGNIIGIYVSGTSTAVASLRVPFNSSFPFDVILSGCPSGGSDSTYRADTNTAGITPDYGNGTTITANATFDSFRIRISSGYTVPSGGLTFEPMIRKSTDTDPAFEPYLGHLYTVQIGQTVYGGTVDLVSGELANGRGEFVFDGSNDETWSYINTVDNRLLFQTVGISIPLENYSTDYITNIFTAGSASANTNTIGSYIFGSSLRLRTPESVTDIASFRAFLTANPLQFVYKLTTPQTIQLTPQQIESLVGENNLSTPLSGQSIKTNGVEYKELFTFADVKSYVDKKIPDAPTTDGTYTLTATVSSGVATYSWT